MYDLLEYRSPWYLRREALGDIVNVRDPDMRKARQETLPFFLTSLNPPPHTVSKQKESGCFTCRSS